MLISKISYKFARIELLDLVKAFAIIGVVIYHFMFDLRLLGFVNVDVTVHPAWVFFARTLSGTFLGLVGFGLVFSHYNSIVWNRFWRRFIIIFISAIGITIATFFFFPDMFVYFGILHAIAFFSLMALPFLRAPIWLLLLAIFFVLGLPFWFSSAIFNEKIYSFIGLWQMPPSTADLVPIFPSFGLTLIGILLARLLIKYNLVERLSDIILQGKLVKFLAKIGRLSLIIYLLHQPILLAILYPIAIIIKPGQQTQEEAFYGACFGSCIETDGSANYCVKYCQCSLEQVEQENLWEIVNSPFLTKEQNQVVSEISNICAIMSRE